MRQALQQLKYPNTFWGLFFIAAALMMAFAFFLGALVLYLINSFHLATNLSYEINGIFSALVYLACILGGGITQRWLKHTHAIVVGLILLGVGCIGTSFNQLPIFISGLAVFLSGYGLVYTSIFYLLGKLYPIQDSRRESTFTLCYTGLNVGALIGFLVGGIAISQNMFSSCALLLGIILLVVAVFFQLRMVHRYLEPAISLHGILYTIIAIIAFTGVSIILLMIAADIQMLLSGVCILFLLFIFVLGYRERKANPRTAHNLYLLGSLALITTLFWTGYRLQNNVVMLFMEHLINRHILDITIPSPTLLDINPIVILIFGPLLSLFFLRSKNSLINSPTLKISLGLFLLGAGFLCLFVGGSVHIPSALIWVVLFLILLSFGELILAPTTISMVGRLAPEKYQSLLLGIVRTDMSAAAIFAGQIAVLFNNNNNVSVHSYLETFLYMAVALFIVSITTLFLRRNHSI